MVIKTRSVIIIFLAGILGSGLFLLINYTNLISFINAICLCNNIWYQFGFYLLLPASLGATLFMIIRYSAIVKKMSLSSQIEKTSTKNESSGFNLDSLTENEKRVYLILKKNGGNMYQKDISVETTLPPYKVSRILNSFAAANLIRIERSGMTNKITLINESNS